MKLCGWGRFPIYDAQSSAPRTLDALAHSALEPQLIARGNGRAYGDSAINTHKTVEMRHFNRILAFNQQTGQVVAESGVRLEEIIAAFLPLGWFPSVTPGTKFVSLGGMVAADVHGKNHHCEGSFCNFIDWIDLMGPDGKISRCSQTENADLFAWTTGGMGLTGIIVKVAFRLRHVETGWIRQNTLCADNLTEALALFDRTGDSTYSVAWIDCLSRGEALGRSLIMLGEHASETELGGTQRADLFAMKGRRKITVPIDAPSGLLNSFSVRLFNALYYAKGKRGSGAQMVDWDSYFYPLDAILGWNRIYGRKGFMQFQCVLPLVRAEAGLRSLLTTISDSGSGSFLAVLKRFGQQASPFSFPMEGYTLALDFPVNPRNLALMKQLDEITIENKGRFYLAKDARLTAETLKRADARTESFINMREEHKLRTHFQSAQSERLGI